jgi:hypothetical protein
MYIDTLIPVIYQIRNFNDGTEYNNQSRPIMNTHLYRRNIRNLLK